MNLLQRPARRIRPRSPCGISPPATGHRDTVAGVQVGLVVPEAELSEENRAGLDKERVSLEAQIERIEALLANDQFTRKAPQKVVDQNRQRLEEMQVRLARIVSDLE